MLEWPLIRLGIGRNPSFSCFSMFDPLLDLCLEGREKVTQGTERPEECTNSLRGRLSLHRPQKDAGGVLHGFIHHGEYFSRMHDFIPVALL